MPSDKNRMYRFTYAVEIEMPVKVPATMTVKAAVEAEIARFEQEVSKGRTIINSSYGTPAKVGDLPDGDQPVEHLSIWTDGGCWPNPGPGGWGVHAKRPDGSIIERNGHGGDDTTNNQMELKAAIEGMKLIGEDEFAILFTDSKYVRDGITSWIKGWKMRGWVTYQGHPVKNKELWMELDELYRSRNVHIQWVRGHSGDVGNERADELATLGKQNTIIEHQGG